ncbi:MULTISPECIES: DUF6355 family natural product biosynthesis protein [unclassified Crossiella]|uniref:DUF6355 family natural product biosynthesis protein n=1 Tax=unclassified Crossiella TaxID=2620835 RepID=UPI001FFE34FA|nr:MULTISPECIES: DUF6355 family natural product biosynthesis protein [unclassified Crossiella]MCK2240864.1 DUF6355 family natural product biosynthesis protein [Crossiella sp. S99.2]MCK2253992.1 DUF6355 family natural product biosynthesis protein [Crossiella sp. S99.1]
MRIARSLTVFAFAVTAFSGSAVALASPSAEQAPCGFFVENNYAKYNHCGAADRITIRVRWYGGLGGTADRCVGKGVTNLERQGSTGDRFISNAYYLRDGC